MFTELLIVIGLMLIYIMIFASSYSITIGKIYARLDYLDDVVDRKIRHIEKMELQITTLQEAFIYLNLQIPVEHLPKIVSDMNMKDVD